MNTARNTKINMPYKPRANAAKDDLSELDVEQSGTNPPTGVKLSCMALTAPQEASVVIVANNAELKMPKRVSLPSILPSVCTTPLRYRFGLPSASAFQQVTTPTRKIAAIAPHTAQPCFWFLTMRPR